MDDKYFLKLAIEQMKKSVDMGGFPAGAVVIKDGEVVARGVSIGALLHDPTSHSETVSIREACSALKTTDLSGVTLYASLQPCLMCFSVANWAGISRIVFATKKTQNMVQKGYYEGIADTFRINELNSRKIELVYLEGFESEAVAIIKAWEGKTGERIN